MTVGNDPSGFSVGELSYYINPLKRHQVQVTCGCGDPACDIWAKLRRGQEESVFAILFRLFPQVSFIVDSSKDPFWIEQQSKRLRQEGIATERVLIWKTPLEIAASFRKRGDRVSWERHWVNYHRLFTALFSDYKSIRYRDFVTRPEALEILCRVLDVPYFPGKDRYWEKSHHILFGNNTARFHLHPEGSGGFAVEANKVRARFGNSSEPAHQSVYYSSDFEPDLIASVQRRVNKSPYIHCIEKQLESHSIESASSVLDSAECERFLMRPLEVSLRRLRRRWRWKVGRMMHGPH